MANKDVIVLGGGLAGSEAAWQAAKRGLSVRLYEMRPLVETGAHHTDRLGEIVCSNSLGSDMPGSAPHILKNELRELNSIIMSIADKARVPAGQALAVDRDIFANHLTSAIESCPDIEIVREEVEDIPDTKDSVVIVATGPLTSKRFADTIANTLGEDQLYFFDAAAPIVDCDSIDYEKAFWASRYDKGDADYLNCPMTEGEYGSFYDELTSALVAPMHDFEDKKLFESCMPVEEIARRGRNTLVFGPLKPVGLIDPVTGIRAYAVLQLRKENSQGTAFNLVGFQTRLKFSEQKRVFSMIPALKNAEFLKYGVMHKNIFINSPHHLLSTLQYKKNKKLLFAGQITGVEGYIESSAMGMVAGINAARIALGQDAFEFPHQTATGALCKYISSYDGGKFQPSNINFGLLPPVCGKMKKDLKRARQILDCENSIKAVSDSLMR